MYNVPDTCDFPKRNEMSTSLLSKLAGLEATTATIVMVIANGMLQRGLVGGGDVIEREKDDLLLHLDKL